MPIRSRGQTLKTGGTPGSAGLHWDAARNGWIGPGGNFVPAGTNAWLSQFEPKQGAGEKRLRQPVPHRVGGTPRAGRRRPKKPGIAYRPTQPRTGRPRRKSVTPKHMPPVGMPIPPRQPSGLIPMGPVRRTLRRRRQPKQGGWPNPPRGEPPKGMGWI